MRIRYILQRVLWMLVSLIGISLITFFVSHVVPADPVRAVAGVEAQGEQVEELRRRFGLDKPLPEQYLRWVVNLAHGDLGLSIRTGQPVLKDLAQYAPATAELALATMLLVLAVGLPLGIVSALNKDGILDHLSRIVALSGVSMPIFWVGLLLQIVFFRTLEILPAEGRIDIMLKVPPHVTGLYTVDSLLAGDWAVFKSAVLHLILPSMNLAFGSLAVLTRMVRSSLVDVLAEDYVRTARAKGLPERTVILRHALRAALIPTTTTMALQMGALMGGVFLVEMIFSWPGLGFYAMRSISLIDFPAIMGVAVLMTTIYAVFNLLADLAYGFLDPRISAEGRSY